MQRDAIVVSAAKGLERDTLFRPSEIVEQELAPGVRVGVLSGPSFASEMARELPTAVCIASLHRQVVDQVQAEFRAPYFRLYGTSDVVGVEIGGALKNVIAIAAGVAEGLGLGQNAQAAIFSVNTNTNYSSSDYNGFRPNPGNESFQWNSPPLNVQMIPADGTSGAKLEARKFATLEAYAQATRQDQHSVLVDYDVFKKVTKLDAKDLATVQRLYKAEDLDFSLRPGSAAVDRGVALPNVTDGFTGQAPDLGALEVGRPLPIYGPRP